MKDWKKNWGLMYSFLAVPPDFPKKWPKKFFKKWSQMGQVTCVTAWPPHPLDSRRPRHLWHPCHLCQDPELISRSSLEQLLVLVFMLALKRRRNSKKHPVHLQCKTLTFQNVHGFSTMNQCCVPKCVGLMYAPIHPSGSSPFYDALYIKYRWF